MATPTILCNENGIITFTLSNKPEYQVKINESDYRTLVEDTNCYYLKEFKTKESREIRSAYVARCENTICLSTGKKLVTTYFLHWDVFGRSFHHGSGLVLDHIDRDSLNNIKENLRALTYAENLKNSPNGDRESSFLFREKGICLPDYYNVAKFKRSGGEFYQAYYKKEYIKCSKDLGRVLNAIEKHQEKNNARRATA